MLDNPQQRTTFGLNIGLANARGDYVVRMDAHTDYPPQYVAKGVERLRRGDGVEWVTGPQIPHGIGPWSRRVAIALRSWLGAGGSAQVGGGPRRRTSTPASSPACGSARRSTSTAAGTTAGP